MKVQVHTYDAEMGRTGGGVMNMAAKSGANEFHGSGYTVFRPERYVSQLLIPKLQGQPNLPEYWRNGGGGGGGPIVKNKTFFWFAGEKYVDNQPQASHVPRADGGGADRRLPRRDPQRRAGDDHAIRSPARRSRTT